MRRIVVLVVIFAAAFALAAVADAQRKPTSKERAQIAAVVQLPSKCARVKVSTVTKKPKWGSVSWRNNGADCMPFASNGVTVTKKAHGTWRFVTAGSSFTCKELYAKVPQAVAQDLKIACTTAQPVS
jgi:uncharacterized protein (UPF0333 family)